MNNKDKNDPDELNIILNNIPMGIYWKDSNLIYRGSNVQFMDIAKLSPDELIGKTDSDFHMPETAEIFRKEDLEFLDGKRSETYFTDKLVTRKDSDPIWARTYKIPVYDENGDIQYIMGLIQDVTKVKEMEKTIIDHSKKLEIAVKEAENASRSKGEFLSRMSHEIRTPLNAIIGMSKIADSSDDLCKIKDCLHKIDSSSKHLLGLINDVLDMSKIEAERFVLSPFKFRFEEMLKDISNVVSIKADEKNQDFEIIIGSGLPEYFYADELRLRQVITNLISNSIKFTPENGTIRLNTKLLNMENDIATVEFTVSDTGIGISPEQQKALFQPFIQADDGITRKYGGTGLGLAICKKIIEMMDGQIYIESALGTGSSFIFNIKIKVLPYIENKDVIKFDDMHALVVDDSYETREYMTQILDNFGIRSETASDGFDALDKINLALKKGDRYNIFFIDWAMPGINGIETTKRIRKLMNDHSFVIMISATAWNEIESEAADAGIYSFIAKPLFPSTVFNTLREISGKTEKKSVELDKAGIPNLEGYKVLIVEDIEINREIAAALLEPTKIKIDFAINGIDAVTKYNNSKGDYDIILMDIHMPEMNGYDATTRIRSTDDPKSREISILAMTADAFKEDIDKCKSVGMNDHISKPINEDILYRKIVQYIKKK